MATLLFTLSHRSCSLEIFPVTLNVHDSVVSLPIIGFNNILFNFFHVSFPKKLVPHMRSNIFMKTMTKTASEESAAVAYTRLARRGPRFDSGRFKKFSLGLKFRKDGRPEPISLVSAPNWAQIKS